MKNRLLHPTSRDRNDKTKVLIALSGGIDSAVSAYLLIKKGCYVEAAFMKNWTSQEGLLKNECPWLSDRRDALRVAAFLGIKLHILDFEDEYQKRVMRYFFDEYKKGRTPNPDVMCNKEIKFKLLYNWALNYNFDFLATGHYAGIKQVASRKVASSQQFGYRLSATSYQLERSVDEFKDQTYFIYNIKKEQLPHLLFPVGGMKKSAVRSLARKIGLPNAEKRESMGLCFVGKIRLKDFLEQKIKARRGEIVLVSSVLSLRGVPPFLHQKSGMTKQSKQSLDRRAPQMHSRLAMTNQVIGHHFGLHNYTIGQRQGIKIGSGGPYFVLGKDLKHNRLYVTNDANDKRLLTKEVDMHSVNWISPPTLPPPGRGERSKEGVKLVGRYRHQGELVPLTASKIKNDVYRVVFNNPQKAVASGQSLVLYRGKECVGGGVIV